MLRMLAVTTLLIIAVPGRAMESLRYISGYLFGTIDRQKTGEDGSIKNKLEKKKPAEETKELEGARKKKELAAEKKKVRLSQIDCLAQTVEKTTPAEDTLILEIGNFTKTGYRVVRGCFVTGGSADFSKARKTAYPEIYTITPGDQQYCFTTKFPIAHCWQTQDGNYIIEYTRAFLYAQLPKLKTFINPGNTEILETVMNALEGEKTEKKKALSLQLLIGKELQKIKDPVLVLEIAGLSDEEKSGGKICGFFLSKKELEDCPVNPTIKSTIYNGIYVMKQLSYFDRIDKFLIASFCKGEDGSYSISYTKELAQTHTSALGPFGDMKDAKKLASILDNRVKSTETQKKASPGRGWLLPSCMAGGLMLAVLVVAGIQKRQKT